MSAPAKWPRGSLPSEVMDPGNRIGRLRSLDERHTNAPAGVSAGATGPGRSANGDAERRYGSLALPHLFTTPSMVSLSSSRVNGFIRTASAWMASATSWASILPFTKMIGAWSRLCSW